MPPASASARPWVVRPHGPVSLHMEHSGADGSQCHRLISEVIARLRELTWARGADDSSPVALVPLSWGTPAESSALRRAIAEVLADAAGHRERLSIAEAVLAPSERWHSPA